MTPDTAPPGTLLRPIPLRAVPLALAALAVPGAGALLAPEWLQDDTGLLLWLTPILPAFLLAYYRGWRGAALALAFGMASLALANVALLLTGVASPEWPLMLVLTVVYLVITQGLAALIEMLGRERRAAERQALTDPLTDLPNRREAERVLARGFDAAGRGGDLSVVVFDLDRFKRVNDVHRHAVGDLVAAATLPCGRVTASAGVASFSSALASPDLLLAAADRALYAAKDGGRDAVRVWEGPEPGPAPEPLPEAAWTRPIAVLVVDDDLVVERSAAKSLQTKGFNASPAGGARGALSRFLESGGDVDVLLTDVVMPDMSGPMLVDRLGRAGWAPRWSTCPGTFTGG